MPGSAAGLGVEPGIPASPVPPGTRRPCSATAAGSQSGKHVPRRGREDACRAPRAQSGEPACVPASRRAAASRPPSGDVTASTLPSRGLLGTEAPGRPPAQPVPARSPPARACCPASQVPQGGLLGEQWGRGQTRARGPDPGPPRAARVPLVRVPSQGRTEPAEARHLPAGTRARQPRGGPLHQPGNARQSRDRPSEVAGEGLDLRRAGGRGAGWSPRLTPKPRPALLVQQQHGPPRGAPAPIPPAPSRSPVPRGRGAADPAERQIRGGRDGCRGAPGGQRGPGHSGGRGDGGRPLAAEGAALHGKVGVTGTLSRPRRGTPRPVPGSQLPGPRPFRPMPAAPASCPAGGKCARAGVRPSEAECVRACAQVWLCAGEADQSQCCEETQCLTRERTAQCLGTFV